MSKRQQKKFDKVYQDFTKRHLLYEPQTRPTNYVFTEEEADQRKNRPKPADTRQLAVSKALERSRPQLATDSSNPDFSQTAPIRLKPTEPSEGFILHSTMSPTWFNRDQDDHKPIPMRQTSPVFKELERNRVLEARIKELYERFTTLQRSYKELLTKSGGENYKKKCEDLEISHKREKDALQSRIRQLEFELQQAKSSVHPSLSPEDSMPLPTNEDLFPSETAKLDTELQIKELRDRMDRAEMRLIALEQAAPCSS